MSELGFHHQKTGSSEQGLTFVRPLPQVSTSAPTSATENDGARGTTEPGLIDRLFPPRTALDSGVLPPVTGLELGHFVIEERIGRGGMGAVFRALDKRLDRVVALKVLSPEYSSDPDAVHRFQNEARAAARLDHDNIARVYYSGSEQRVHFIAFEFVTGTNIRALISHQGRISPADTVNYGLQIAEALRHTWSMNVVHRDVKPSNIIVSANGRAKLVDLGLARNLDSEASRELTVAGTALGTFDYISPEQAIDARNVDVRSDLYSLGCTLYHMLTGTPPYPNGTMFEKVMNHHRPTPPDPAVRVPNVNPLLSAIVQKLMASNPDDRYDTPELLIADLMTVAQEMGLAPIPAETMIWTPQLPMERPSRWKGAPTWTAVAILLLVLVLADRLRMPQRPVQFADSITDLGAESTTPPGGGTRMAPTPSDAGDPAGNVSGTIIIPPDAVSVSPSEIPMTGSQRDNRSLADNPLQEQIRPVAGSPTSGGVVPQLRLAPPDDWLGQSNFTFLPSLNSGRNEATTTSSPGATPAPADRASGGKMSTGGTLVPRMDLTPVTELPGSAPLTSSAPLNGQVRAPVMVTEPFVVIDPTTEARYPCSTLSAACSLAKDNWAIEVQATGTPLVQTETLSISDKRIRIRPGREFQPGRDKRPLIRFDTANQQMLASRNERMELMQINRGALEFYDVDIELLVDPASIVEWSFVALSNGSRLTATGASVTIVNPFNIPTSFVSVPENDAQGLADRMPDRMTSRQNRVELQDCVVRGQIDFLEQSISDPLHVSLQNTALALSGWVFRVDGSKGATNSYLSDTGLTATFALDHVTAISGYGLLSSTSGEHGSIPIIKLSLNNCVFRVEEQNQPFIEITGHEEDGELRQSFEIEASRNRNFFQLTGPLCVIESSTSLLSESGRELTAEQLGLTLVDVSSDSRIHLSSVVGMNNWHSVAPTDLELRQGVNNPAIGASGDLQNAGVNWQATRLPRLLQTSTGNPDNR